MRAVYLENIDLSNDSFIVSNDKFHHLKNVIRVKVGQEVLILNGNGESRKCVVSYIDKKKLELKAVLKINKSYERPKLILYLGLVKKDALELCVKSAVELNCSELVFLETEFSQKYKLNEKRIDAIIENAMEQSNAMYKIKVRSVSFDEIDKETIEYSYLASNKQDKHIESLTIEVDRNIAFIGPEGGFSSEEESYLLNHGAKTINLDTNILRSQTALPAIIGFINGMRLKIDA